MIQFNLLPDVKKEYIKAKRTKRLIFTSSIIAAGASLTVLFLLFSFVNFGQKKSINDLTKDIEAKVSEIKSIEDLDKILTIQSQLNALPGLHQGKTESSRLFNYLTQLTPSDVKITSVSVDFENLTMTLEGNAPSLASINRFADTLKFSKFRSVQKVGLPEGQVPEDIKNAEAKNPFSNVATELSRNEDSSSYEIMFTFDALLFDNAQEVVMVVPKIVTTRSTQGKPDIDDQTDNPLFDDNGGNQ